MPNQRTENRSAGEGAKKKKRKKRKKNIMIIVTSHSSGQKAKGCLEDWDDANKWKPRSFRACVTASSPCRVRATFFFLVFAFGTVQDRTLDETFE